MGTSAAGDPTETLSSCIRMRALVQEIGAAAVAGITLSGKDFTDTPVTFWVTALYMEYNMLAWLILIEVLGVSMLSHSAG